MSMVWGSAMGVGCVARCVGHAATLSVPILRWNVEHRQAKAEGIEMTRIEYAEYELAYAWGVTGLSAVSSGACSGCNECCDDYDYNDGTEEFQITPEAWFAKSPCEACGTRWAGNRFPLHGVNDDNSIVHLDVCDDCVYYSEYGRLDDQTMEELSDGSAKLVG